MLRWTKMRRTWCGSSGEKNIASFYKQGDREYLWCVSKPFGDGVYRKAETEETAKAAAESAFRAWLDRAGMTVIPAGWQLVPIEPPEEMWCAPLVRALMMWLSFDNHTPKTLFNHLESLGIDAPQWLTDEPELQALDHVPSKGTPAVIIYNAMLAAAPKSTVRP